MDAFEQAAAEIETFGFTLLPDVLTASQVTTLRRALIRVAEEHGEAGYENRGGTSLLVRNLPTRDPVFLQIVDHPVVLPILERMLDKTLVLGSLSSRIVRPGDGYQDFHSDIPQHMLNPVSPVMMNTIWMLDDFRRGDRRHAHRPGSHKSGWAGPPAGMEVPHVLPARGFRGQRIDIQRTVLARRRRKHHRPQPARPLRALPQVHAPLSARSPRRFPG